MKNKLTNNLGMRLLALLIAILIWTTVVNVSDPIIESTYSGIQVELVNVDAVAKQNKTIEILDNSDDISVTISAKRSISDLLSRDNIRATADLANLNLEKGTVRIKLETNKYNDKIESVKSKNDTLFVKIEDLMKRQFPIGIQVNGEPENGYVIGDTSLEQNVVTVQGPESVVSLIEKASVDVSVAGMSNTISTTSMIRFYDANGNLVDTSRLSCNISAVNLKVDILAKKTLGFRFYTSGELAKDYSISGEITSDIKEVTVAGKSSQIATMSAISIPGSAIDVEGKKESFTQVIDVTKHLPENVVLVDDDFDGKITVSVPIEKMETKTVVIPRADIVVSGFDKDAQNIFIPATESECVLELKGLKANLNKATAAEITGSVLIDEYMEQKGLSELGDGIYRVPISFTLPEGVTIENEVKIEVRVKNIDS